MNFELFISTGFFAAIAASIFSVVMSLVNNRHIKRVESAKKNFELQRYRYKKLHEYLEQMISFPEVTYDILTEHGIHKMVQESTERFGKIKFISYAVIPILDEDFRPSIKGSFEKEAKISQDITSKIYARKNRDANVVPLIQARNASEEGLVAAIQEQLERLILSRGITEQYKRTVHLSANKVFRGSLYA